MNTWDEYSGYYCLLIAILCDLDASEAWKMYEYGPNHPICQKFLKKKVKFPEVENIEKKASGKWMLELQQAGYTLNEIASFFSCYPSTAKKRINKAKKEIV